jgi:gluconokinase
MDALGMVESIDVAADLVQLADIVEPDPAEAATYAELLPTFAALYDQLEPTFRALQRLGKHEQPAGPRRAVDEPSD